MSRLLSNKLGVPLFLGGGMMGEKERLPPSQFAFSPPGWPLSDLGWVVGVSAQEERTSVLQGHSHALPPYQSAHM